MEKKEEKMHPNQIFKTIACLLVSMTCWMDVSNYILITCEAATTSSLSLSSSLSPNNNNNNNNNSNNVDNQPTRNKYNNKRQQLHHQLDHPHHYHYQNNINIEHRQLTAIDGNGGFPIYEDGIVATPSSDYKLAGYRPYDMDRFIHAARIDLDQVDIEQAVSFFAFRDAQRVYQWGGHSFSVATLYLAEPFLQQAMTKGSAVIGNSESLNGGIIRGTLLQDTPARATSINVLYPANGEDENGYLCFMGASLLSVQDGCFASTGIISIGGMLQLSYSYNAMTDTTNLSSMKQFNSGDDGVDATTNSESVFFKCQECPPPMYQTFINYFGVFSYADSFIQAAVQGKSTNLNHGNIDFSLLSFEARAEAIPQLNVRLNVWMYVVGLLDLALESCRVGDTENNNNINNNNNNGALHWDEAFAIYTGSLEGSDGSGNGKLLYHLADELCAAFDTCTEDGGRTTSLVNQQLVDEFQIGQTRLLRGQCDDAITNKDRIVSLMTAPLVQGMLHSATQITLNNNNNDDDDDDDNVGQISAFTFALSVLPLIHKCDESTATIIYDMFRLPVSTRIHPNTKDENDNGDGDGGSLDPIQSLLVLLSSSSSSSSSTDDGMLLYKCLGISCDDLGTMDDGTDICTLLEENSLNGEKEKCDSNNKGGNVDCDEDGNDNNNKSSGSSNSRSLVMELLLPCLSFLLLLFHQTLY